MQVQSIGSFGRRPEADAVSALGLRPLPDPRTLPGLSSLHRQPRRKDRGQEGHAAAVVVQNLGQQPSQSRCSRGQRAGQRSGKSCQGKPFKSDFVILIQTVTLQSSYQDKLLN